MERYCDEEVDKVKIRYSAELHQFQTTTIKQLDKLDLNINLSANQNSAFVNALKEEVE